MTELLPFMTKEDIDKKVSALARRISADYENRDLVIIGVLKGSFIFYPTSSEGSRSLFRLILSELPATVPEYPRRAAFV